MVCTNSAGSPAAANDFVCKLTCQSGPGEGNGGNGSRPAAGIFNPPYAINNGATQLAISTKVSGHIAQSASAFVAMYHDMSTAYKKLL